MKKKNEEKQNEFEGENFLQISQTPQSPVAPQWHLTENLFPLKSSQKGKDAPGQETMLEIYFKDEEPVKVVNLHDGTTVTHPIELFLYLNMLGRKNKIKGLDNIEKGFIDQKSKAFSETPGSTILQVAYHWLAGTLMNDMEGVDLENAQEMELTTQPYPGFQLYQRADANTGTPKANPPEVDGKVVLALMDGEIQIYQS